MSVPASGPGLRFACPCVSAVPADEHSDPWAEVAQRRLFADGTKEKILNSLARGPRTVAAVADELGLSRPSVLVHVQQMMESELLRETPQEARRFAGERFYEPNFPIVKAHEQGTLDVACAEIADQLSSIVEQKLTSLRAAFAKTELAGRGWEFEDVAQYLFACIQRQTREQLEARGRLPPAAPHANGTRWTFWAEEPGPTGTRKAKGAARRSTTVKRRPRSARA
jgi:DNA-binding transcriptional ArsR family regulator